MTNININSTIIPIIFINILPFFILHFTTQKRIPPRRMSLKDKIIEYENDIFNEFIEKRNKFNFQ